MIGWLARILRPSRPAEGSPDDQPSPLPGWLHGFGVYRESPWHLAGLHNERRGAERRLKKLEQKMGKTGYQIAWGRVEAGLDNFVVLDKDRDVTRRDK